LRAPLGLAGQHRFEPTQPISKLSNLSQHRHFIGVDLLDLFFDLLEGTVETSWGARGPALFSI
jgi:hypothetical protein